jgi:DeoR family lactose phosphotransferase system repressor
VNVLKSERQDAIVAEVSARGAVTVAKVAKALGISEMTVRRDLDELSAAGRLMRVRGGAKSLDPLDMPTLREYTNDEKHLMHARQKASAAIHASKLIRDGETIFVGTGTTGEALANQLKDRHLRIITNSLYTFNVIKDAPDVEPVLVGGYFRSNTGAFVGAIAERMVEVLGIDRAFIGANGICDGKISTANSEEGNLQRLVFERSTHRYVICDASKVGRRDFFDFYDLSKLEGVICDDELSPRQRDALEKYTQVLI